MGEIAGPLIIAEALPRYYQWDEFCIGPRAPRENFTPALALPLKREGIVERPCCPAGLT